ncbi:zinc ribbon domain-containing protein [Flavobacterium suncheonense]|uniref:zinc ribbon domain-containing protein n=1 Tax=Flavobacterium suncheonense TaxID=350894 RepID=UPI000411E578|nr:zinc ribbon domain-containing protein [Flavobacterium suncheonense]
MNINIPDKISKFLVLIGILLLTYGIYRGDQNDQKYFEKIDLYNQWHDSVSINELKTDNYLNNLKSVSEDLAIKYNIKNPIYSTDSTTHFNRLLNGEKNAVLVSDSINKMWETYVQLKFKNKLYHKKADMLDKNLEAEKKFKQDSQGIFINIIVLGFCFLMLGLFLWFIDEHDTKTGVKQSDSIYKWCQSCGKSFSSIRINGLNKDGQANLAFCNCCYDNGEFTKPQLTKEDFLNEALIELKSKPWLVRKLLAVRLNNLDRWNPDKY